jgi:hypothetical protein
MTTACNFSQNRRFMEKHGSDNARLYLLMTLIGSLTLFFVFGTPDSEPGYSRQSLKANGVTTNSKIEKADPATMYKTIVTNGDAIRSVLQ